VISSFTATPGVDVITTTADIPALGSIAINAFVLHGPEPVLIDTGTVAGSDDFLAALDSVIDPKALRWIWLTQHVGDIDTDVLQAGQVRWATIDSPWVHAVDRDTFAGTLDEFRSLEPTMVCSSHLPPAPGAMLDLFVDALAMVPDADRFIGPDQAALEAMLSATGGATAA
jgi:hypothetical protein